MSPRAEAALLVTAATAGVLLLTWASYRLRGGRRTADADGPDTTFSHHQHHDDAAGDGDGGDD